MEEKGPIKVRLSTVILLIVIFLLIIAMIFLYCILLFIAFEYYKKSGTELIPDFL